MALVVFLRGVNVGGHRRLRPAALVAELKDLGAVNIGAAGTFVIQRPVARAQLRAELARRLPFDTDIAICDGCEIIDLVSAGLFSDDQTTHDVVRFVSVLCGRPRSTPPLPIRLPSNGQWLLRVIACDHRFVVGEYRRHMKAIGYLGTLDRIFGVPLTTRNWNTVGAIAKVLRP